ncbi:MAG: tripartite tricarboxylate transporter TctB family protein [Sphaerochaetaceae bacterium]|nr:tripartite tricarboxylate transporter TctB family protein [Sphaerochaetaceae bacterium]
MLKDRKPIPIAFSMLSILYFIYVVSSGSSKMIGDEIGGDPGGMVLPLFLSIFMFISSMYLLVTDRKDAGERDKMSREERQLFVLTFAFAIGYILLTRFLGFILCTVLLLFFLCFANLRRGVRKEDWKAALVGCVSSVIGILVVYSLGRVITRSLLLAARKGIVPSWLGASGTTSALSVLVVIVFTVIAILVCRRFWAADSSHDCGHSSWFAGVISVTTTEILYIIFKQLFLVELIKGLITW